MASNLLSGQDADSLNYSNNVDERTPLIGNGNNAGASNVGTVISDVEENRNEKAKEDFSFSQLHSRSKYTLILCSIANLFVGFSFSILGPFFPKEAAKKGVSTTVTGLIFSMFELVIFLSSPLFGMFMTKIGVKFMFASGICVGGCCCILFGVLDKCPPGTTFVIMCFATRSLEALAMSAFVTASFAILSNEFPKHVATVIGISETFSGIGMMVGPAVGGALYELAGYGAPFFVMGGLIILNGLMLIVCLPAPKEVTTKRKGSVISLFFSPMVLVSLMSICVCSLGISFLDPTFSPHLSQFDLSTGIIGLVFVIAPALYALCSPLWGYLVDSKNVIALLIVPGHLFYGLSLFLVGPSSWLPFLPSTLWIIIIGLVVLGISIGGTIVPNMKNLVSGAIEVGFEDNLDTYGLVSGLFNSFFCLGSFIGPTLGGVLVEQNGFNFTASIMGVINLIMATVAFVCFFTHHLKAKTKEKQKSKDESSHLEKDSTIGHNDQVEQDVTNVQSPMLYGIESDAQGPFVSRSSTENTVDV